MASLVAQRASHLKKLLLGSAVLVMGLAGLMILMQSPRLLPEPPSGRAYWPTTGWLETPPEDQGVDADALKRLDEHIRDNLGDLYSLLIVRHGYLVFEEYYQGFYPEFAFEAASITKSITSALVGIALQEGYLTSIDQRVVKFFPDYDPASLDSRAQDLTIRHLLSMTSGFDWSEDGPWLWPEGGDWMRFALGMSVAHPPGDVFTYNTPSAHLLSGILTRATGMSLAEFAETHLFKPLGITGYEWSRDPMGFTTGAHALNLTARDLAKLGYLNLNHGSWEGTQLIPEAWVEVSTRRHSDGGFPEHTEYGYLWWVTTEKGHSAYFAAGYGGQYIYVIPDLDVVVVITSSTDGPHPEHRAIVGEFIIPAVLR